MVPEIEHVIEHLLELIKIIAVGLFKIAVIIFSTFALSFHQMLLQFTTAQIIAIFVALSAFLWVFYALFISPIIFNFFIIPSIEKKLRKRLPYRPWLNYIV